MSSPRVLEVALEAAEVEHVVDDLEGEAELLEEITDSASICASVPPPGTRPCRARSAAGTAVLAGGWPAALLEQPAVAVLDHRAGIRSAKPSMSMAWPAWPVRSASKYRLVDGLSFSCGDERRWISRCADEVRRACPR